MKHYGRWLVASSLLFAVAYALMATIILSAGPVDAARVHALQAVVTSADTLEIPRPATGLSVTTSGNSSGFRLPGGPFDGNTQDFSDSIAVAVGEVVTIDLAEARRAFGKVYVYPGSGATMTVLVW